MKTKKSAKFWVAIALIICLISSVGAMVVQTNGGSITIKELYVETSSGLGLDALLLVPENATAQTPAPAIVTSHGWFNNKEMQDLNYLEYAKRGYVVISISMYGHGDSEIIHGGTWWTPEHNANGMYDAVKLLTTLPYVDASRIGVTGHSNGGLACKEAVRLDNNAETQLISSVLLVSCDPIYTEEDTVTNTFGRRVYDTSNDTYTNFFGSRDVGFIACEYDEFFNCVSNGDGTWTAARDYIHTEPAQSFLHFGVDPTGMEERAADTIYKEMVDAPIIILDEATANVDPESEQELTSAIEALTKEKTILMIAHRLKTVRHADKILVIDDGKIVQSGTHEQLMQQGGIYRRFVESRELAVGWKV